MIAPKLTEAQRAMLRDLAARGGKGFARGPWARKAKELDAVGLLTLEDCGYMRGNSERWWCEITDAGRAALRGSGT